MHCLASGPNYYNIRANKRYQLSSLNFKSQIRVFHGGSMFGAPTIDRPKHCFEQSKNTMHVCFIIFA